MSLRKYRSSAMGKSSTDIRSAFETKHERKERLPLHASVYPYYESQLGLPRVKTVQSLVPDPILTQTDYYRTNNKPLLLRQTLTQTKASELGIEKVFTGDKSQYNRNPRSPIIKEELIEKKIDKYHVSKEVEHKKATQETQLVHIEQRSNLAGKVDVKKVADIRRTIRRRYANRNDFRKIFNQWDENSIGVLTPEDIHKMVNRIGISINIKEAKVLVASANKSNTGALNLNEFMGLIFDQDDKLNVDLALLADDDEVKLKVLDMHTIAVNKHTELLQTQLKAYLKDKIHGLSPQFTRKDKKKTGKISFEEFVNVMNNMDIPHALSSEKNFKLLYKELGDDSGLNYHNFLSSIDNFIPPIYENTIEQEEDKIQEEPEIINYNEPRKDPLMNLNILNRQKVPVNQLENFFIRARKIRLFLSDNSESEENLKQDLMERSKNKVISLHVLKDYVIDKLQEKKTVKITKKELEGFLSSYIYNKDGVTLVEDIVKNIFMEDTKASFELHQIKRSVPPIREANELIPESCTDVKRILQSIEEKFYDQGSQKATNIFKKFDRDRDGYVTQEDMEKALDLYQIVHNPEDVKNLMAFLDTNKNGYITFKEFSSKIQPNIITINRDRLLEKPENHTENYQPSLEFLTRQQKSLTHFYQTQEEYIKEFKPDDKIIKFQASTRYGAKPPHQNTFVHYHMPLNSSLSQEVIAPKKFLPFNIGGEDKAKKMQLEENKVQNLKKTRGERIERWSNMEDNAIMRDTQKVYHRAISKEEYEKKCKLTSPFANMSIE